MASVTGRDGLIQAQALAYAIVALERVPELRRPRSNKEDMFRLLRSIAPDEGYRALLLDEARATLTGIGWYVDPPPSDGNVIFPTFG